MAIIIKQQVLTQEEKDKRKQEWKENWQERYCDKIQDDEFTLGEQRGSNITFK